MPSIYEPQDTEHFDVKDGTERKRIAADFDDVKWVSVTLKAVTRQSVAYHAGVTKGACRKITTTVLLRVGIDVFGVLPGARKVAVVRWHVAVGQVTNLIAVAVLPHRVLGFVFADLHLGASAASQG